MQRKAVWGWLFIGAGLLWWMANMGWIRVPWKDIEDLWPLLLIGGGVMILPASRPVKAAIGLICLAGVVLLLYMARQGGTPSTGLY